MVENNVKQAEELKEEVAMDFIENQETTDLQNMESDGQLKPFEVVEDKEAEQQDTFKPEVPMVKPILDSFDEVESLEHIDSILMQIGQFLVTDKPSLSKWI